MKKFSRETSTRILLTLLILLSGAAMLPFIDSPVQAITWRSLAGVYEPELTVNADAGRPGSVFAFTGSNYPADSLAMVYANGEPLGSVMVDSGGMTTFKINSAGADIGQYNITLEVDINASATTGIALQTGGELIMPPPGFTGPTFDLGHVIHLPFLAKP